MSRTTDDKNARLGDISRQIVGFCDDYLDDEYENFCINLAKALGRKQKVDIRRGRSEQWAASIVYVIARLNFLFDKKNPVHVTVDDICDYFGTKKTTTSAKATHIEKICDVHYGREEYCTEDISDMFAYYETENGLIIPKFMIDREIDLMLASYGLLDESDDKDKGPTLTIEEQRKIEKEHELNKAREKAEKNRTDADQLGLFDN